MTDIELLSLIDKVVEQILKRKEAGRLKFIRYFFEQYSKLAVVRKSERKTEMHQLSSVRAVFYSVVKFLDVLTDKISSEIDNL